MSPIQGFVRLRKHQFGRQQDFGTKVAATRAYPHQGTPDRDLGWTDPEIDAGSRDPVAAPYHGPSELTASLTYNALCYNDVIKTFSGFFGGAEVPSGGGPSYQWEFEPASMTVDEVDPYTYEFGDDVLTDWFQMGDGILESFDLTIPTGLGACTVDQTWRFGSTSSTGSTDSPVDGSVPTDLDVDLNPALIYGKDLAIYIADSSGALASSQIMDALHSGVVRFSGDIDEKRYANGTQTFDAQAFARASRAIEFELTFAKTSDIVGTGSESDNWMSDQSVDRYIRFTFTSTVIAETPSTPYSWTFTSPCRYYTRTEGDEGGNTTVVLTGHAFYDADEASIFNSSLVCTLTDAELGTAVS
jgi:hypothetical protein